MMKDCGERQWLRWTAAAVWMGLIFFLSGQQRLPNLFDAPDFQDIAGHFAVYAVLALLLRWALVGAGAPRASAGAFVLAFLYGISDEFHQSFVPGRHPDLFDIFTDALGAGVILAAHHLWRRRQRSRAAAETS